MTSSSALDFVDFPIIMKGFKYHKTSFVGSEILSRRLEHSEKLENLEIENWSYISTEGSIMPLVSVDASSVIIGMRNEQPIEAVRAAILVKLPKEAPRIIRLGPYLRTHSSPNDGISSLEVLAKKFALSQITKGIVLLDGLTLYEERQTTQSTYDQFYNDNTIISIVKKFVNTKILPQSIDKDKPLIAKLKGVPLYLLKLGREPIVLKSEIYPPMDADDAAIIISNLLKSDSMYMAYPNSLRLSHMYSKILFAESIALQKLAMRETGIVLSPVINDRKIILGPIWS